MKKTDSFLFKKIEDLTYLMLDDSKSNNCLSEAFFQSIRNKIDESLNKELFYSILADNIYSVYVNSCSEFYHVHRVTRFLDQRHKEDLGKQFFFSKRLFKSVRTERAINHYKLYKKHLTPCDYTVLKKSFIKHSHSPHLLPSYKNVLKFSEQHILENCSIDKLPDVILQCSNLSHKSTIVVMDRLRKMVNKESPYSSHLCSYVFLVILSKVRSSESIQCVLDYCNKFDKKALYSLSSTFFVPNLSEDFVSLFNNLSKLGKESDFYNNFIEYCFKILGHYNISSINYNQSNQTMYSLSNYYLDLFFDILLGFGLSSKEIMIIFHDRKLLSTDNKETCKLFFKKFPELTHYQMML